MAYLGVPPQSGFITTAKQRVTSSTNAYVDLDHAISSIADVIVFVNFVKQDTTNLTLTNSTRITLGATLVSSDIVEIHYLGKAVNTQTPGTSTVTSDMLAGSIAQSKLSDEVINEAKMQISNSPVNGYMLTAQSGNTGGLTWAEAPSGEFVKVGSLNLNGGSTQYADIGSIFSTTYNVYKVFIRRYIPIQNDNDLKLLFRNSSGGVVTSNNYRWVSKRFRAGAEDRYNAQSDDNVMLITGVHNSDQTGGANLEITIKTDRNTSGGNSINFFWEGNVARNNNEASFFVGGGYYNATTSGEPPAGLRFYTSNGNISQFKAVVYGLKEAL